MVYCLFCSNGNVLIYFYYVCWSLSLCIFSPLHFFFLLIICFNLAFILKGIFKIPNHTFAKKNSSHRLLAACYINVFFYNHTLCMYDFVTECSHNRLSAKNYRHIVWFWQNLFVVYFRKYLHLKSFKMFFLKAKIMSTVG